jgi:hypothetical protein
MSHPKSESLTRHVPASPAVPRDVPDSLDRRNKANLLTRAAAEVTDAMLWNLHPANRPATATPASGGIALSSHLPMSPDVPPRPAMPPDVPDSAIRKNKANLPVGELSHIQLAAIRLLLAGQKVTAIARELHISRRTLLRWRQIRTFRSELQRQHDRLCKAAGLLSRDF